LVSKATNIALPAGGTVRLETPGGGGWGKATDRGTHATARDAVLGYVT
jgi:N-methylhydantoinase B